MNNATKILLTVIVAGMTGVLTYFWLEDVRVGQTSFAVYRAASDIFADETTFSDDFIEIARFPEEYRSYMGGAVIEANPSVRDALLGRVFNADVPAGALLLYEHLETDPQGELSSRLQAGQRALTIPVNAPATVGYFVEPGSLVDILGTVMQTPDPAATSAEDRMLRVSTLTLLQAVRVLAVGRAREPAEYRRIAERGYTTVTVAVTPEEAEKLVFAMTQVQSGLTLVLRNPDDTDVVQTPSVDWRNWREAVATDAIAGERDAIQ